MLGIEDALPPERHPMRDRFLDHCQVLVRRRLQDSAHLPRVALPDQGPGRRLAAREGLEVGIVRAGAAGTSRSAERGQARPFQRVRRQLGEELLVLRVRAREAPLDVIEAEAVEGARDAQLVRGRERYGRALGAIAQGRVIDHDPSCGAGFMVVGLAGHKKTSRPSLAGRSHDISDVR